MIKFLEGEMIDLLSSPYKEDVDIQALSYAMKVGFQYFQGMLNNVFLLSEIDNLDEWILDCLAIDFRLPYYDRGYELEKKRELVKLAFDSNYLSGSLEAISRLADAIFGETDVTRTGSAEFSISIGGALVASELEAVATTLENVKAFRDTLKNVNVTRTAISEEFIGSAIQSFTEFTVFAEWGS